MQWYEVRRRQGEIATCPICREALIETQNPQPAEEEQPELAFPNIFAINGTITHPNGSSRSMRLSVSSGGGIHLQVQQNPTEEADETKDADEDTGANPQQPQVRPEGLAFLNDIMQQVQVEAQEGREENNDGFEDELVGNFLASMIADGNEGYKRLLQNTPSSLYARGEDGVSMLHIAIYHGHDTIVKYLLTDMNIDGDLRDNAGLSPVHIAVITKNIRILSFMIEHGCYTDALDRLGKTPLMYACEMDYLPACALLMERGAGVYQIDHQSNTCLHIAVANKSTDCVKFILEHEVAVSAKNVFGDTPLHLAVRNGFFSIARSLLDRSARLNAMNKRGITAYEESAENSRVRALLDRY
jgi:ankyrin repeat protein